MANSLQSENRKRGKGAYEINSVRKLVRLHRESKHPNSINHHTEVCLQHFGINPRDQISIGQHPKKLLT